MTACRTFIRLLPVFFLVNTMFAGPSEAYPLQIKVLSAEFHGLDSAPPVPKDCDLQNFSAYCNESKKASAQNVMLVQDSDGKSFSIACTVDSRWSRCAPLTVGKTFDARKDKRGITVLYRDAKGKERKQLYQLLATAPGPQSGAAADSQPQAAPPPPRTSPANSPVPAPVPPVVSALGVLPESVNCSFSSTPSGAEIDLDGRFVGNTPSEIAVSAGTHVVVFSMPGFAQWKRELTVAAGSVAVNVTVSLQKTQP